MTDSSNWSILADEIFGTGGIVQIVDPDAAALLDGYYRLLVLS